jgi:hypothetical protein
MSNIDARLTDLERRLREGEVCPTCGWGSGRITLRPMSPDGTPHPPPEPCTTCGRTPKVIRMRPIRFDSPRASAVSID